jgi:hypothetical protein
MKLEIGTVETINEEKKKLKGRSTFSAGKGSSGGRNRGGGGGNSGDDGGNGGGYNP